MLHRRQPPAFTQMSCFKELPSEYVAVSSRSDSPSLSFPGELLGRSTAQYQYAVRIPRISQGQAMELQIPPEQTTGSHDSGPTATQTDTTGHKAVSELRVRRVRTAYLIDLVWVSVNWKIFEAVFGISYIAVNREQDPL